MPPLESPEYFGRSRADKLGHYILQSLLQRTRHHHAGWRQPLPNVTANSLPLAPH